MPEQFLKTGGAILYSCLIKNNNSAQAREAREAREANVILNII
jgi:hypothetical protein